MKTRLARAAAAVLCARHAPARGVVEDVDAVGAGEFLHEPLDLGVVDAPDFLVVEEVAHRALVLRQGKAIGVERHIARDGARIVDRHLVGLVDAVAARHAGRRLEGVVARPLRHRREIVHVGFDVRQAGDDVRLQAHGQDLRNVPPMLAIAPPRAMEKKCGAP